MGVVGAVAVDDPGAGDEAGDAEEPHLTAMAMVMEACPGAMEEEEEVEVDGDVDAVTGRHKHEHG